jgi:hypothetical protein
MKTPHRLGVAVLAVVLCLAATQYGMRGRHTPTFNTGYLGTELAGVEGEAGSGASLVGVRGSYPSGGYGWLGGLENGLETGVYGSGTVGVSGAGSIHGVRGTVGDGSLTVAGVYGLSNGIRVGVKGESTEGIGVLGVATLQAGVTGVSPMVGVFGNSQNGFGVQGNTSEGTAIYGLLNGGGHAGYFDGRVHVNGTLSKSAGSFKIDHPLDPANRYLSHSFVESPDMKNIYDGVVVLDVDGSAIVELPAYFDALNENFRYQLTCIGEPAQVYIAEEIHENKFRIAGGYSGMKVSWQVTGSRKDPYARRNPIVVEEPKGPREVGRFLHPELYGAAARISPVGEQRQ